MKLCKNCFGDFKTKRKEEEEVGRIEEFTIYLQCMVTKCFEIFSKIKGLPFLGREPKKTARDLKMFPSR